MIKRERVSKIQIPRFEETADHPSVHIFGAAAEKLKKLKTTPIKNRAGGATGPRSEGMERGRKCEREKKVIWRFRRNKANKGRGRGHWLQIEITRATV